MSIAAIQDSLVKTSFVQQTQSRGDDIHRGQENAIAVQQREQDRQEDQVVIRSREAEQNGVRDEEKKRQQREQKEEEERERAELPEEEADEDEGPRARMRCINIVV